MTISSWRREPEDASRPTLMTDVYKLSHERLKILEGYGHTSCGCFLPLLGNQSLFFISTASFSSGFNIFLVCLNVFSCLIYVQSSVLYLKYYLQSLLLVFDFLNTETIYLFRHLKRPSRRSLWVQEEGWLQNEKSTFSITFCNNILRDNRLTFLRQPKWTEISNTDKNHLLAPDPSSSHVTRLI